MAYGLRCKNCGHQESPHLDSSLLSEEEAKTHIRGYQVTIDRCHQFEYAKADYPCLIEEYRADPNPNLALPEEVEEKIAALDEADGTREYMRSAYEQQGRARAAFGAYVHHSYHERLEKEIGKLDDAINNASNSVDRQKARDAKAHYLQKEQQAGQLYIG